MINTTVTINIINNLSAVQAAPLKDGGEVDVTMSLAKLQAHLPKASERRDTLLVRQKSQ